MKRLSAAASLSITVKRCGSFSRFSKPRGRSGSWPSASRSVSANFAGAAVSRQTSVSPGRVCSRPTLIPSAVCGSTITPYCENTQRMVAMRSACVLRPETNSPPGGRVISPRSSSWRQSSSSFAGPASANA